MKMNANKYYKKYHKNFVLCDGKSLKDLEPYGFQPTYDEHTGQLIKESLIVEGEYGERPLLEMSSQEIITPIHGIEFTPFIMRIYKWSDFFKHITVQRSYNKKIRFEIWQEDETTFNVLLDLIEDGIIERKESGLWT